MIPKVFCDNLSATYTCVNLIFHTKMKHLALDYFFVREKVNSNELKLEHVPSTHQLDDALEKHFQSLVFLSLLTRLVFLTLHQSFGGLLDDIILSTK